MVIDILCYFKQCLLKTCFFYIWIDFKSWYLVFDLHIVWICFKKTSLLYITKFVKNIKNSLYRWHIVGISPYCKNGIDLFRRQAVTIAQPIKKITHFCQWQVVYISWYIRPQVVSIDRTYLDDKLLVAINNKLFFLKISSSDPLSMTRHRYRVVLSRRLFPLLPTTSITMTSITDDVSLIYAFPTICCRHKD